MKATSRAEAKTASAVRYFTGKPCRRSGHIDDRYTATGICVACQRESNQRNRTQCNEASRRWYHANKDRLLAAQKAHDQANPHIPRARAAKYRAAKMQATPAWADQAKIAAIYAKAVALGLEVDHTIPLTHKLVCGLHVEHNLQLLSKKANAEKANKYEP